MPPRRRCGSGLAGGRLLASSGGGGERHLSLPWKSDVEVRDRRRRGVAPTEAEAGGSSGDGGRTEGRGGRGARGGGGAHGGWGEPAVESPRPMGRGGEGDEWIRHVSITPTTSPGAVTFRKSRPNVDFLYAELTAAIAIPSRQRIAVCLCRRPPFLLHHRRRRRAVGRRTTRGTTPNLPSAPAADALPFSCAATIAASPAAAVPPAAEPPRPVAPRERRGERDEERGDRER
uniref:Uncharacterized protein n=1 Tax=Oryza sativa subsp. japonica TaxID=39947 RepID=Q60DD7_ORYSJ|nr:hypothetical protein [Oryza sativa Japonica Group]